MSNFFTAAKSDSCILAVHPWFGGSWWSKLNKGTPRDFSQGPKIWDSFYTVQNSLDLSHDYSFVCEFENAVERGSVFYISSLRTVFGIFQFNSSSIIITSNLLQNTITGRKYIEVTLNQNGQPLTGRHSAKMTIIGNTATVYLDGNVIATIEGDHIVRNIADEFEAPSSSCGYLYHITLADLTTNSVVWQPEHSDLYVQYVPRNFADNPMTFTDSYTAQDGIGTDDFTLSVDFTLLRKNVPGTINIGCMQCIYYDSTKGYQPSVRILKSDGTKDALYPVGTSHITGDIASIKVIKTGQNVRMVVHARDGSTVKDQTKPLPDGATVTSSSGATTYPGNIFAASIRNDTTGTAVWQAAYSDLYDTSNPWPSPVPRNFAEEPEAWRDLMAVIAAATETDWSFKIRYNLNSADGSQRIFSPGNNTGPIAVFWSSEGILYLRTIGGNGTIIQANPAGDPTGMHTVEIIATRGLYSIIYDWETVHSVQDTPTLPRSSAEEVIQSGMNGTILYAEFSCGKAVWRYPSEAERVRLITKTNVRTDRGAFEAADHTIRWNVKTPLRWSALRRATVLVRTTVDVWNTTLISMGQPTNPNNAVFAIRRVTDSQVYFCIRGVDSNGNVTVSNHYAALTPQMGKFYDFAFTFDLDAKTVAYYLDGTLLKQGTSGSIVSLVPEDETLPGFMIGTRTTSDSVNAGNRAAYALVFNRALSESEIKLLSTDNAV